MCWEFSAISDQDHCLSKFLDFPFPWSLAWARLTCAANCSRAREDDELPPLSLSSGFQFSSALVDTGRLRLRKRMLVGLGPGEALNYKSPDSKTILISRWTLHIPSEETSRMMSRSRHTLRPMDPSKTEPDPSHNTCLLNLSLNILILGKQKKKKT